jgi:hypothetical protein
MPRVFVSEPRLTDRTTDFVHNAGFAAASTACASHLATARGVSGAVRAAYSRRPPTIADVQ